MLYLFLKQPVYTLDKAVFDDYVSDEFDKHFDGYAYGAYKSSSYDGYKPISALFPKEPVASILPPGYTTSEMFDIPSSDYSKTYSRNFPQTLPHFNSSDYATSTLMPKIENTKNLPIYDDYVTDAAFEPPKQHFVPQEVSLKS